MATQAEINAALAAELAARPNTSAYDLAAYAMQTYGITPAQIDRAYQSLNVSALPETIDYETNYGGAPVGSFRAADATGYTGPSHKVTDPTTGKQVELIFSAPGFDPIDPTTLRYLGEQKWRDPNSYGALWYENFATPAQKAQADASWAADWKKLNAQDVAAGIPGAIASGKMPSSGDEAIRIESARLSALNTSKPPTGLLTDQPVQGASDTAKQAMDNLSAKKSYTDTEVKQALKDLSYLDPKASVKDIITAAQTYGIDRDRVVKNISSFTYTAENVDKLAKQILAQNTTATWKGDVKPETAARYMADDLAKSGVTDISQVARGDTGIINKETGEKLVSGYGERTKGNLWSGSYEGAGNTGFGVQFTETGAPIFYTEGASSSTLKKDLLKAAVIAGAAFGLAGPESLAGIFGSSTAATTALGAEAAATGLTLAELGGTAGAVGGTTGLLSGGAGTVAGTTAGVASTLGGAGTAGSLLGGSTLANSLLTSAGTGVVNKLLGGTSGSTNISNLLSGGLGTAGNLLQMQTSREAAQKAQAMIDAETAAAKTAAQFRPIGMTTRFGTSQFQVDPVTGQLTSAGYTLSPSALQAQDRLVALGNQGLAQAEAAQGQFAPLQTGAQRLFELGQGYLAQSPQEVAQNYLNQQMALLQPGRELELATLQNRLQQQGRGGLAVAQGGTLGATTPELQAMFNARAQQEAQLAAQAQQAGQQQVAFGAGLLGTGAQTMGQYYGGQQQAYAPYTTALGQVQALETAGQQPFTLGAQLGQTASTAGARMGQLGLQGAGQSVALATGADATRNLGAQSLIAAGNPNAMFGQALGNVFGGLFGSAPVNALSSSAYGPGNAGFQNMLNDIYG